MTGFTKGKFRVGMIGLTNEGQRPIMCNCDDGTVTRIAVVDLQVEAKRGQKWNAVDEERDANANLFAASPQLYEALECVWSGVPDSLRKELDAVPDDSISITSIVVMFAALRKVKAALQAARGER